MNAAGRSLAKTEPEPDPFDLQPRLGDPTFGVAPRKIVRATRRVAWWDPRWGTSRSICAGSGVGSVDVGVDHWAPVVGELAGELTDHPGVVERHRARQDQRERSSLFHSAWITAAIRRRTPRVRWKRSTVDQSS